MNRMLKTLITIGAILGAGVLVPHAASAQPIRSSGIATFTDPLSPTLSDRCGFDVVGIINGRYLDRSVVGTNGSVQRQVDVQSLSETVTAPDTGVSFSFPVSTSYHYRYRHGTDPGDAAFVSVSGLGQDVLGSIPLVVAYGNVVTTNFAGFPVADFGEAIGFAGKRIDPALSITSMCTALAGSCAVPAGGGKWHVTPDGWCPIEPC